MKVEADVCDIVGEEQARNTCTSISTKQAGVLVHERYDIIDLVDTQSIHFFYTKLSCSGLSLVS